MSTALRVKLLFFASVREQIGYAEMTVDLPAEIATVGAVRDWMIGRGGVLALALAHEKPLRMAYRQTMCDGTERLSKSESDQEIAFFPPVTGG